MKKSILIAIVSFLAGAATTLVVAWFAIGGVVSDIMGADDGVNMTVEGVDKEFCDELFGIN